MKKADLVAAVSEKTGSTKKDAEKALGAVLESIQEGLAKGERISLVGFGTFETRTRPAREGRNPRTDEKIYIPETVVPAFKPGKSLKEAVKK